MHFEIQGTQSVHVFASRIDAREFVADLAPETYTMRDVWTVALNQPEQALQALAARMAEVVTDEVLPDPQEWAVLAKALLLQHTVTRHEEGQTCSEGQEHTTPCVQVPGLPVFVAAEQDETYDPWGYDEHAGDYSR